MIRKKLLAARQQVSTAYRQYAAKQVTTFFINHWRVKYSRDIGCYYSIGSELNIQLLIRAIWAAGKYCYMPIMMPNGLLTFALYQPQDSLYSHPHSGKILEPSNRFPPFPAQNLDIVIMPLIGFDHQGNRLGSGKGYYDRTFLFRSATDERLSMCCPYLLGAAYAQQEVDQLPVDAWDIRLDGVLTEKAWLVF